MERQGIAPAQIGQVLNVSPQYVSKGKGQYEAAGATARRLGYRGSESYLSVEQRREMEEWIGAHGTLTVDAVRDYVEERDGVVSQSTQAYYELLEVGERSSHRREKVNLKRDEVPVLARREAIKKNWRRTGKRLSGGS